jgi:L-lactate utilization protein LutC
LNTVLPYYDDVIITMQKYALMHLNVDETQLKKNKLLQFITEVCENNNKYKVMVNNDLKTVHFVEIEEDDNDELDYQEDVTNQEEKVLDNDPETSDEEGKKNL